METAKPVCLSCFSWLFMVIYLFIFGLVRSSLLGSGIFQPLPPHLLPLSPHQPPRFPANIFCYKGFFFSNTEAQWWAACRLLLHFNSITVSWFITAKQFRGLSLFTAHRPDTGVWQQRTFQYRCLALGVFPDSHDMLKSYFAANMWV